MALVLAVGIGAGICTSVSPTGNTIPDTGDIPTAYGKFGGWFFVDNEDEAGTAGKAVTEKDLKPCATVETVSKSVSKPTKADPKNTRTNSYGTVDWSTAAQGYITFTAKGQERVFILQGPNTGVQAMMGAAKDETIKVALVDGTGKYQYAIANTTNNGKNYSIQYKHSFTVKTIDSDLAPYLVSTPWGDFENAPEAVKKANELWDDNKSQPENAKALADWAGDLKYDEKLMQGTISVYVNPDSVIENGGGVCNENGVTYAKGAWVSIEAVGGSLNTKAQAKNNYGPDALNYAN